MLAARLRRRADAGPGGARGASSAASRPASAPAISPNAWRCSWPSATGSTRRWPPCSRNLPLLARADFGELMRRCARRRRGPAGHDRRDQAARPEAGLELQRRRAADAGARSVSSTLLGPAAGASSSTAARCREVLVDTAYHAELGAPCHWSGRDKEYLAERLQSANWLAKALDQRARTVLRVAKAIFARQLAFLDGGVQHLRPLVLRDIAEATGLHESTVSRATADKYVATPHGTFPLKYFFTTAIAATSGEAVAQRGGDPPADQADDRARGRRTTCSRTTRSWPSSRSAAWCWRAAPSPNIASRWGSPPRCERRRAKALGR